jgi:hypothetical protein
MGSLLAGLNPERNAMASIFVRLMHMLRGKEPEKPSGEDALDRERAERGLQLSDLDGDAHTTAVLSERLGIRTRISEPGADAA